MPYYNLGQTNSNSNVDCSYVGIDAKDATGQKTLETLGCKIASTDGVTAKYCCPKAAAEQLPPDIKASITKVGQGLFRIPSDMLARVQQTIDATNAGLPTNVQDPPPPPSVVTPSDVVVTEQIYPAEGGLWATIKAHPYISLGVAAVGGYLIMGWLKPKPKFHTKPEELRAAAREAVETGQREWPPTESELEKNPARLGPNHRLLWEGGKYFSVQRKANKKWKNIGSITKHKEGNFYARCRGGGRSFAGPHAAARWVVALEG